MPGPFNPSARSATLDGFPFTSQPRPDNFWRNRDDGPPAILPFGFTSHNNPHDDVPHQFRAADEYWEHYDKMANLHDKGWMQVLNDTLDNMLVFGGLLSAVVTTLLVYTLPSLNPAPDAQTVALLKLITLGKTNLTAADLEPPPFMPPQALVGANCCLAVSLAFCLLASYCALVSKRWVSHFTRDYSRTLETYGRWHQRKLRNVAEWKCLDMIEASPILLQISLVVFAIGISLFLQSVNKVLDLVFSSSCIAFLLGYLLFEILAILFPEFPFQSPHTALIRHFFLHWAPRKWRQVRNYTKQHGRFKWPGISPPRDIESTSHPSQVVYIGEEGNDEEDVEVSWGEDPMDAQSVGWVLELAWQKETLLAAAKYIPALHTIEGTRLCQGGPAYSRLDSHFKNALTTWRMSYSRGWTTSQTMSYLTAALTYGRALMHCTIGGLPMRSYTEDASRSRALWPNWETSPSRAANELLLIKFCVDKRVPANFCIDHAKDTFPDRSATLHTYLAAILAPSPLRQGEFHISGTRLDRITLVQWLTSMSFADETNISPITLNIGAWCLGNLPRMISGVEDGEIRGEWWHAYTSDRNLYRNLVQALNMYHYYQLLQSALQSVKIQAQSDYSPLLRPEQYAELYTQLLRAFRTLINTGAYHHEVLTVHMLELDGALRQLRLTVSRQTEGSQHENDERSPFDALEEAIGQTMDCLRKDAMEVMFPRATSGDAHPIRGGGSIAPAFTSEYLTSRLRNSPTLPDAVVKALKKEHEGSRYAALAMIHDYAPEWFTDDKTDLHERFTQAGLVPTLRACMTNEENLPLVSGIIVQLMDSSLWARELIRSDLLRAFLGRGTEVLHVSQPRRGERNPRRHRSPFRVLEYILDVWRVCNAHPDCESLANEWRRPEVRQRLIRYIHSFSQLRDNEIRPLPP
ncbi:hypothetical protein FRB99_008056, partial [Tulasnella sp. 403]